MVINKTVPIKIETLTRFADEARRLVNVEDELSTADMLEIFSGASSALPTAESAVFGSNANLEVDEESIESGISTTPTMDLYTTSSTKSGGYKFTAAEDMALTGFRVFYCSTGCDKTVYPTLFNSAGEILAKASVYVGTTKTWTEVYLDSPVFLSKGETYTVGLACTTRISYTTKNQMIFNEKLLNVQSVSGEYTNVSTFDMPTKTETQWIWGIPDVIIAGVVHTDVPNAYSVQRGIIDDIAKEVQRIFGIDSALTLDDIAYLLEYITQL